MLHHDLVLGVVRPGTKVYRIVPIYAYYDRHINFWLLVCVLAVIFYVRWVLRTAIGDTRRFSWKLAGWFLVIVVTVAMLDGGPKRLWRPFDVLRETDYIGGVESVDSPGVFLRDYAELREDLPMHCQTHPPGAILFLWCVDRCLGPGPIAASLVTILFVTLSIPAVVGLARLGAGDKPGRLAACFFLLAPNVVLFTATSMDAVFMVPMVWTVYLLFLAVEKRTPEDSSRLAWSRSPWFLGLLAGLCASIAAMMTFSAALIALWAIILGLVVLIAKRDRFPATFTALATALATAILFYVLLYLGTGYHLLEVLYAATSSHESIMSGGNYGSVCQYFHLMLGNLVAFLAGSGIPISVLYLCTAKSDLSVLKTKPRGEKLSPERLLNYTFLATFFVTLCAPIYTLEVERIWIFWIPFLAIGAVRCLDKEPDDTVRSTARLAMILLAIQTIVMESFLETLW